MNVQLPDGTTIEDVPDGTTKAQLREKLARNGYDVSKLGPDPAEDKAAQRALAKAYSLSGKGAEAGIGEQLAGGAKRAWDRAALGLKGMVTDLTPEDKALLEQGRSFVQETGPASSVGEFAGDVAITAPAAAFAPVGAGALAARAGIRALPRAAAALGRGAGTIGTGAGIGYATNPEDRAGGAAGGAAGAALGLGVQRAVGGVLRPLVSKEGRELIAQGIQPTPGQAIGGMAGSLEEKAKDLPLAGDIIRHGRGRAVKEWNEAITGQIANRAAGGALGMPRAAAKDLGKVGNEATLELGDRISNLYETVLEKIPRVRVERQPIANAIDDIVNDASIGLSEASAKRLQDYAAKHLLGHGDEITGKVAKRIESDLGDAAYNFSTGTVGEDRAYGQALRRLHEAWRESLANTLPWRDRNTLRDANAAYRGLRQVEEATKMASSQNREAAGVFTPRVLRQSMAALDKSRADRAFIRAQQEAPQAVGQDPYEYAASMVRAGKVLGDTVPDSGTPGRILANVGWGTAIGGGAHVLGALPQVLGALGATGAAYSRAGSYLLTQGVFPGTAQKILTDAAKMGIPEQALLSAWPTMGREIVNYYGSNP